MYKTKCAQCGQIFDTEEKYYSFVCGKCTQRMQEMQNNPNKKAEDEATLRTLRSEVDNAIANGEPEELIRIKTQIYNNWLKYMRREYGTT